MKKKAKSFDGVNIHYDIIKKSDFFIVFLHGLEEDLNVWEGEIRFLNSKNISTLAVDLRGHGLSDKPKSVNDYSLDCSAKDIYEILIREKIKKFVIAGYCYGGLVAIRFHKLFPKLAKGYIFISTDYRLPKKYDFIAKNKKFNELLKFINDKMLKQRSAKSNYFTKKDYDREKGMGAFNIIRLYHDLHKTSIKTFIFSLEQMNHRVDLNILRSIKQPTLIVYGKNDEIVDKSDEEKMHKLIKKSHLDIIPDSGHMIAINNVKEINNELYSFITSINRK